MYNKKVCRRFIIAKHFRICSLISQCIFHFAVQALPMPQKDARGCKGDFVVIVQRS